MKDLLEYKGYHAAIDLDLKDNIFVGTVIGINDSLNFHGSCIGELQEQFEICIDDYLEMCKAYNKTPEKEYKGSFNVRISPELHKNATLEAIREDISLNEFTKHAIEFYLGSLQHS